MSEVSLSIAVASLVEQLDTNRASAEVDANSLCRSIERVSGELVSMNHELVRQREAVCEIEARLKELSSIASQVTPDDATSSSTLERLAEALVDQGVLPDHWSWQDEESLEVAIVNGMHEHTNDALEVVERSAIIRMIDGLKQRGVIKSCFAPTYQMERHELLDAIARVYKSADLAIPEKLQCSCFKANVPIGAMLAHHPDFGWCVECHGLVYLGEKP